jgi:hypothetical protein
MSIDFPKEEEEILKRWKEINAFQRQLELSEGRKHYTFYDGCAFSLADHTDTDCRSGRLSQLDYPIMAIFWHLRSKTSFLDIGP